MARDEAYREAEKKIEVARRSGATKLDLSGERDESPKLTELPESLGQLTHLQSLDLADNQLSSLPEWLGQLTQLQSLDVGHNQLTTLPGSLGRLAQLEHLILLKNRLGVLPNVVRRFNRLRTLFVWGNGLSALPSWISELAALEILSVNGNNLEDLPQALGELQQLKVLFVGHEVGGGSPIRVLPECVTRLARLTTLHLHDCQLTDLPTSLAQLEHLAALDLEGNPLNLELAAAYQEGLDAVKRYLHAKAEAQVVLNEAKLILVGEGEVGKSCLLDALRGDPWKKHVSTHGIEIKPVKANHPDTGTEITLNGWDFGGQRVYRPTHQLFFSAPAVYLVVWKPREGPQQGFVKDWIKLIKHREPDAKILVVATHGGPGQRQPDLDRQEIWDLFGKNTVIDFFHVESKPDRRSGKRRGIDELKQAIARVAATLPEMGRSVPTR